LIVRDCDSCRKRYEAKTRRSKFCSPDCRLVNHRGGSPKVEAVPVAAGEFLEVVERELVEAGRLDSVAGRQALMVAEKMQVASGSGLAALSKELTSVLAVALQGSAVVDPLDELRVRREARRTAG